MYILALLLELLLLYKSIDASSCSDFKTGYDFEIALYIKLIGTHDQLEGVTSFNEKRKPLFIGS